MVVQVLPCRRDRVLGRLQRTPAPGRPPPLAVHSHKAAGHSATPLHPHPNCLLAIPRCPLPRSRTPVDVPASVTLPRCGDPSGTSFLSSSPEVRTKPLAAPPLHAAEDQRDGRDAAAWPRAVGAAPAGGERRGHGGGRVEVAGRELVGGVQGGQQPGALLQAGNQYLRECSNTPFVCIPYSVEGQGIQTSIGYVEPISDGSSRLGRGCRHFRSLVWTASQGGEERCGAWLYVCGPSPPPQRRGPPG